MFRSIITTRLKIIVKVQFSNSITGAMAPKRQGEMAEIVTRALVCGIFVSILNACVAG